MGTMNSLTLSYKYDMERTALLLSPLDRRYQIHNGLDQPLPISDTHLTDATFQVLTLG